MLPDEMWEEVLNHLDVFELLKMQPVSKHWNKMITRVIKRACKWYKKCVATIPEDMWSSLLTHQAHLEIRCENFHEAKIHSEIWMRMYRSWMGWTSLTDKSDRIGDYDVFEEVKFLTHMFCDVTGNILVVGSGGGQISFYNMSQSMTTPIWQVHHGAPIGDIVLCRSGNEVLAVSYSIYDLRYWDIKAKKLIHQATFGYAGRILKSNFDYCYSLSCHEATWILNVEQFVSGTVRLVRRATFADQDFVIKALGPECHKAIVFMDSEEHGHKFCMNLSDSNFETLSFHQEVHGEATHMFLALNSCFKIFKPRVATYIRRRGKFIAFSVNAKPWRTYDVAKDICDEGSVSAILYHVKNLMIAIEFDRLRQAEVRIYSVENINDLERMDFHSMEYKNLKFMTPCIDDLAVTEYNSCQYLLGVAYRKVFVVKFL